MIPMEGLRSSTPPIVVTSRVIPLQLQPPPLTRLLWAPVCTRHGSQMQSRRWHSPNIHRTTAAAAATGSPPPATEQPATTTIIIIISPSLIVIIVNIIILGLRAAICLAQQPASLCPRPPPLPPPASSPPINSPSKEKAPENALTSQTS